MKRILIITALLLGYSQAALALNKSELLADMNTKVATVVVAYAPVELNNDINGRTSKEYSYRVRYPLTPITLSPETDISIVVFDEGLQTEVAYYNNNPISNAESDYETMVRLATVIDPGLIVLGEEAPGVWKVKFSDNSVKLATLNSAKTGFINIATVE